MSEKTKLGIMAVGILLFIALWYALLLSGETGGG